MLGSFFGPFSSSADVASHGAGEATEEFEAGVVGVSSEEFVSASDDIVGGRPLALHDREREGLAFEVEGGDVIVSLGVLDSLVVLPEVEVRSGFGDEGLGVLRSVAEDRVGSVVSFGEVPDLEVELEEFFADVFAVGVEINVGAEQTDGWKDFCVVGLFDVKARLGAGIESFGVIGAAAHVSAKIFKCAVVIAGGVSSESFFAQIRVVASTALLAVNDKAATGGGNGYDAGEEDREPAFGLWIHDVISGTLREGVR